jgi:hypothetical protein
MSSGEPQIDVSRSTSEQWLSMRCVTGGQLAGKKQLRRGFLTCSFSSDLGGARFRAIECIHFLQSQKTHIFFQWIIACRSMFISSLLVSYNWFMCLCSLARLADVLDCVEPFATSAPQSLLVQLSLTTFEPQMKPRPTLGLTPIGEQLAKLDRIVCAECNNETLVDPVKEHVFCLSQECWHTEGHLIVPKNMETSQSVTMSSIKLVTPHEEGSLKHPLLRVHHVNVVSFGLEVKVAEDFLLRLMEPPLYSILLYFESLVDISLNVVNDKRTLCRNAENSQGGFNIVEKDNLDLSKLNRMKVDQLP